jgi:phage/plasmid-like protein (TIGR03299 family)
MPQSHFFQNSPAGTTESVVPCKTPVANRVYNVYTIHLFSEKIMNQTEETDLLSPAPRIAPWQELGINVKGSKDSATAIKLAGLDWEVHQSPVRYFDGTEERTIESLKINYRADTGNPLGVVTNRYTVVQNQTVFEFADRLVGEGLQYDMAGVIQDGRKVWLEASLPESKILDDIFTPNLLFVSGHDGKSALLVCTMVLRQVCSNGMTIPIAKRMWYLPHVRTVQEKMIDARRTLSQVGNYMDELSWRAETLVTEKLGKNDLRRFVEKMFPAEDTDRKNNRVEREIERFRECYFIDDLANFTGTKWGLLLAVSDYVTHKPARTLREREGHFLRMMEGHELLDRAYSLITTM